VVESAEKTATTANERPNRRTVQGLVTSAKTPKTLRVQVDFLTKHPKYGKYLRRRTVLAVHDENREGRMGDRVEIAECRPMSATKHWRLVRVLVKGPEEVPVAGAAS